MWKIALFSFAIAVVVLSAACASQNKPDNRDRQIATTGSQDGVEPEDVDASSDMSGPQDNFPHPRAGFSTRGSFDDYADKAGVRDRLNGLYRRQGLDPGKVQAAQIAKIALDLFKQGNFADARLVAKDAGDLDPATADSWYPRAASIAQLYKKPAGGDFDSDMYEIAFSLDMALFMDPALLAKIPGDKNFDKVRNQDAFKGVLDKYRLVGLSAKEQLRVVFVGYHSSEMEFDFSYLDFKVMDSGKHLHITDFDRNLLNRFYIDDDRILNDADPKTGQPIHDFPPAQPGNELPCRIVLSVQPGGEYSGGYEEEYAVPDTHLKLEYALPLQ